MKLLFFREITGILILIPLLFPVSETAVAQTANTDSEAVERMQFIQRSLNGSAPGAKRWWYGWVAGYSAATVGQGIVYLASDSRSTRQDMALGVATTLVGAAGQLLTPKDPFISAGKLNSIMRDDQFSETRKLEAAEELLERSARVEQAGRSWKMHALTGAVNLGSGLVTWIGFRRTFRDGLANFSLNTVITEAQILSQPTRCMKAYKTCRQMNMQGNHARLSPTRLSWSLAAIPGGACFRLTF